MTEKSCFKCKRVLPLERFYPHPQMGDGHLNKCMECAKSDARSHYVKLKEAKPQRYYNAPLQTKTCRICEEEKPLDSFYFKLSGKHNRRAECTSCFNSKRRGATRRGQDRWNELNRHKKYAHCVLNRAVNSGKLSRPTVCSACGGDDRKIHGHHDNYDRPLDVRWLCTKCHGTEHRRVF